MHGAYYSSLQAGVVGPEAFRRKKTCLSLIITLHFISAIISAIYTSLNTDLMVIKAQPLAVLQRLEQKFMAKFSLLFTSWIS